MKEMISSFYQIVDEIVEITAFSRKYVEEMVWMEALDRGSVVSSKFLDWKAIPHVYSLEMERFYKESDAFIFELMVESCRKGKRIVINRIKERILRYININKPSYPLKILMFGDGVGSDTIFLDRFLDQANFFYFDIPDSKTYEFAIRRFKRRNVKVNLITDSKFIPRNFFDIIVCLEVLEHLQNPIEFVSNLKDFLKSNGIVFITESFGAVSNNFPTHLESNLKYAYKTPLIFLKNNLYLNYFPLEEPYGRPMEFVKKEKLKIKEKINIYTSKHIMLPFIKSRIKNILKKIV